MPRTGTCRAWPSAWRWRRHLRTGAPPRAAGARRTSVAARPASRRGRPRARAPCRGTPPAAPPPPRMCPGAEFLVKTLCSTLLGCVASQARAHHVQEHLRPRWPPLTRALGTSMTGSVFSATLRPAWYPFRLQRTASPHLLACALAGGLETQCFIPECDKQAHARPAQQSVYA